MKGAVSQMVFYEQRIRKTKQQGQGFTLPPRPKNKIKKENKNSNQNYTRVLYDNHGLI